MTRPTVITVTWQPTDGELLAVTVEVPTSYPDVVAEAAMHARRLLTETLAEVLAQYGARQEASQGGAAAVDPGPDAR